MWHTIVIAAHAVTGGVALLAGCVAIGRRTLFGTYLWSLVAMEVFLGALGQEPHQKERRREDVTVSASQLLDLNVPGGTVTEGGLRNNVNVALQYLNSWLNGNGAAAIFNLMEDVATAEIARSQLWQWIHSGARLSDGKAVTKDLYETVKAEELGKIGGVGSDRLRDAAGILDSLVEKEEFTEFLTLPAYNYLD